MLYPDTPIKKSEDDALGRKKFAEDLAKTLLDFEARNGFTIGLQGEWGSGKTSLINMVIEKLEEYSVNLSNKPIIIEFNPWLISNAHQLVFSYLQKLAMCIGKKEPKWNVLLEYLYDYAGIFQIIPTGGNIISFLLQVFIEKVRKKYDKQNDIAHLKGEIIKELIIKKPKIIVIMDDIDRLSSEEIKTVFNLVKSVADFPHITYLLTYDRTVVVEALKDVQYGDGSKYLEKIIQVPYNMPELVSKELHNVFINKLERALGEPYNEWNEYLKSMINYGVLPVLKNMRDVNRLLNTYSLKLASLENEINPADLLGLVCIQVFEPATYSHMHSIKDWLCGISSAYLDDNNSMNQNYLDLINKTIKRDEKDQIMRIIRMLFPRIPRNLYSSPFIIDEDRGLPHTNSISNPNCFERYFTLSLEDYAVPREILHQIIYVADIPEMITYFESANKNRKLGYSLKYIIGYLKSSEGVISEERAGVFLEGILISLSKLMGDYPQMYAYDIHYQFEVMFEMTIRFIKQPTRNSLLNALFSKKDVDVITLTSLRTHLNYVLNNASDGYYGNNLNGITIEELNEISLIISERIFEKLSKGDLLDNVAAHEMLMLVRSVNPSRYDSLLSTIFSNESNFVNFICGLIVYTTLNTPSYEYKYLIRIKEIEECIDLTSASEYIRKHMEGPDFSRTEQSKKEKLMALIIFSENPNKNYAYISHTEVKKRLELLKTI